MVYRRRRILLSEIDRQCRFAMIAYSDASAALERRDAERCWYSLQGLIAAALQLHRLLWPEPDSSQASAVELRGALEIPEDSPLNQAPLVLSLDLLATLEAWGSPRPAPSPSNLGTGGLSDASYAECVRSFDPETGMFTLFGNVVELPALLNAISDLAQNTEREMQHLREVV
ncbi:MAG TPA: hypothetical protein VGH38_36535 [Bryobacteraceae bacterium]|jgi:hypothetical protein